MIYQSKRRLKLLLSLLMMIIAGVLLIIEYAEPISDMLYTQVVLKSQLRIIQRRYGVSVKTALEKYPISLIRDNIKEIYCLDDLIMHGSPFGGTYKVTTSPNLSPNMAITKNTVNGETTINAFFIF